MTDTRGNQPPQAIQLSLHNFDYDLPDERIARFPTEHREDSKLLVCNPNSGEIDIRPFTDISELLSSATLLVANNSRVIHARVLASKDSGGSVEVFLLAPVSSSATAKEAVWTCLFGGKKLSESQKLFCAKDSSVEIEILDVNEGAGRVRFTWTTDRIFEEVIETVGEIPLPPYLKRAAEASDNERYQTVYAQNSGSVAAPTAGLHFTDEIFEELQSRGIDREEITLHVGLGTFKPITDPDVTNHSMHAESFSISVGLMEKIVAALEEENDIVAVGTTSCRVLESLAFLRQIEDGTWVCGQWDWRKDRVIDNADMIRRLRAIIELSEGYRYVRGSTSLMIVPGFDFRIVSSLITNFHQPKSSLLCLVSAFIGDDFRKVVYERALTSGIRFLSYGDSSLLFRKGN